MEYVCVNVEILLLNKAQVMFGFVPDLSVSLRIKYNVIMQKVRFGVVGTNFISDWVIEGAREDPRFELVAVCSRSREHGGEFAARHSIAHVFTSLDEMASSPLIDAVYIASPNFMHAPQSILA